MIAGKKAVVEHLRRIHCGGLISDAVLSNGLKCEAVSTNRDLMVFTSDLAKIEPLPQEIGVIDLDLLIKMIELGDADSVAINPTSDGTFIVIDADGRTVKLALASPRVITSKVDEANRQLILNMVPTDAEWVNLGYRLVAGVLETTQKLSAESMTFIVTPEGTQVVVGDPKVNSAAFSFPELKAPAPGYSLVVQTKLLAPVLKQLTDFTKAAVALTGPDSVIAFREGQYLYIVSPDKPVAEKK